jgi:hypothetical protein
VFNGKPISLAIIPAVVVAAVSTLSPVAAQAASPHIYSNGTLVGTTPIPIEAWGKIKLESGIGTIECVNQFWANAWNPSGGGAGRAEVEAWTSHTCIAPTLEETFHAKAFATAEPPLEYVEHEGEYCTQATKRLAECPNSTERAKGTVVTEVARRLSSLPWKIELKRHFNESTLEEVVLQRTGLAEFGESGTSGEKNTKCYPKNAKGEPEPFTKVPAGCILVNIVVPAFIAEYSFYGTLEPEAVEGIANGLTPGRLVFHGAESGKLVSPGGTFGEGITLGEVKVLGASGQQLVEAR